MDELVDELVDELTYKQEIEVARRMWDRIVLRDHKVELTCAALRPLAAIWDAYLANELDDEARRFWGANLENENKSAPDNIELYSGRGGKGLLWLSHCRDAAAALSMLKSQTHLKEPKT